MKWRPWSGLKGRLILTYLLIFLVSTAIVMGRAGVLYAQNALESAERVLEVQAYVTASALERPWLGRDDSGDLAITQLQTFAGIFAQGASAHLTILDGRGQTLVTSMSSVPANQAGQPEVEGALKGWVQHSLRLDPITGTPMIYAAAPIERLGHVAAVVQISVPVSDVVTKTRQFWLSLALTALAAAALAALAALGLASQIVRPVDRLRDAATGLASGNLDQRVETPRGSVTEIAQLAGAFNHMAERIQDMINRQRNFVANASHELRTPVTNIKLRAEALGNGALDDPEVAQRFVGEIESEANRLGRMASDLLTLSRQDATAGIFREPVELGRLVGTTVGEMTLRAEKSGVTLTEQTDPDLPVINADPVALRTVVVNLIDNALQYTPAGGRVTVSTGCTPDQRRAQIQVTDTGAGIPPEDLPHIFERFYRADKARSRRSAVAGSGAGLGLAIVSGIVEEHGGTVTAESVPGEGTTMTVTLPMDAQAS